RRGGPIWPIAPTFHSQAPSSVTVMRNWLARYGGLASAEGGRGGGPIWPIAPTFHSQAPSSVTFMRNWEGDSCKAHGISPAEGGSSLMKRHIQCLETANV
ncbi:hypothetical protein CEXT_84211, partial [Caerostris extrusa]